MKEIKIYFANDLFTSQTRAFNEQVVNKIRANKEIKELCDLNIYLPQENDEINDKENVNPTAVQIYDADNFYLDEADILVAVLDGVTIDAGVATEIGRFSGMIATEKKLGMNKKPRIIIGYYSDIRTGEGEGRFYINLYTKGGIEKDGLVVNNAEQLEKEILKFVKSIV